MIFSADFVYTRDVYILTRSNVRIRSRKSHWLFSDLMYVKNVICVWNNETSAKFFFSGCSENIVSGVAMRTCLCLEE